MRRFSSFVFCSLLITASSPTVLAGSTLDDRSLGYTYLAGNTEALDAFNAPVLLQFWASWCQSCSGVTRDLAVAAKQSSEVRHIAISTDETLADAETQAGRLAELADGRASVVHDTAARWASHYKVQTVPTVIVLDHAGNELGRFAGHPGSAELTQIASLLSRASAAETGRRTR